MNPTITIHLLELYEPWIPPLMTGGLEPDPQQAHDRILSLVQSLGRYRTKTDLAHAIALLITPFTVKMGLLSSTDCPPMRIIGAPGAKQRFQQVLIAIYGEQDAARGCKIS